MPAMGRSAIRRIRSRARRALTRGVVLVYHRIAQPDLDPWDLCVAPKHFAEHLELLTRNWRPVQQRDVPDQAHTRQQFVCITLDDGYRDNLTVARPQLERFAAPATAFLTTSVIYSPQPYWWDELAALILQHGPGKDRLQLQLGSETVTWDPRDDGRMNAGVDGLHRDLWLRLRAMPAARRTVALDHLASWVGLDRSALITPEHIGLDEVGLLADGDLVEAGGHTRTHSHLPTCSAGEMTVEVEDSRTELGRLVSHPLISFAYPFGAVNGSAASRVARAGFTTASMGGARGVTSRTDPLRLPRLHVTDCDGDELERRLSALGMRSLTRPTIK